MSYNCLEWLPRHSLKSSLFSIHRQSPLPVRRSSNPYKDSKPPNNRLSVAVRAQQRHSPRGPNGDRSKPSKAKEKKESREGKEAASKAKDDKVKNMLIVPERHVTYVQTQLFALLSKHAACLPAAILSLLFQFCVWEKPAHM